MKTQGRYAWTAWLVIAAVAFVGAPTVLPRVPAEENNIVPVNGDCAMSVIDRVVDGHYIVILVGPGEVQYVHTGSAISAKPGTWGCVTTRANTPMFVPDAQLTSLTERRAEAKMNTLRVRSVSAGR